MIQTENFQNQTYLVLQTEDNVCELFQYIQPYADVLEMILSGYKEEEIRKSNFANKQLDQMNVYLQNTKISQDEALAIYLYTSDYDLFTYDPNHLELARNIIKQDLYIELMTDVYKDAVNEVIDKVETIADKDMRLVEKYHLADDAITFLLGLENKRTIINSKIRKLSILNQIGEIQKTLNNVIARMQLKSNIKLFRAVNLPHNFNIDEYIGQELHPNQLVSASALKEKSFAKYSKYSSTVELFVEKGASGLYIAPLSCYDTEEQEVLLFVKSIKVIDVLQNGKAKTIRCIVS